MKPAAAARSPAAIVLSTILLAAGPAAVAADSDIDFASILLEEFGYADLAIGVFRGVADDTKRPNEVRASAHLHLAEVYMDLVEGEADTSKKGNLTGKAQVHLKDFQRLSGREGPPEIILRVAVIQRHEAMMLKAEAEKEGLTGERRKEILKKAVGAFEDAISQYGRIQERLKKKYDDALERKAPKRELDRLMGPYGTAWFQNLWTRQMKAEIMQAGEVRAKLLESLIEEIDDDFVPHFLDWGLEYYGRWLGGVCLRNAGKYKEAIEVLDEVLADLKEKKLLRELEDVTRKVYLQKADVYEDWAKADTKKSGEGHLNAVEAIDALFKQFSSIRYPKNEQQMNFYCRCLLKQAKAYADLGKYRQALGKVAWIFQNASSGWKNLVAGLVEKWRSKAETAAALFMMARQHMKMQNYEGALRAYRRVMMKATADEMSKYADTAWNHTGMCYFNLNQLYEAGICFGKLATLGGEFLRKGLFLRTRSFGKQFYASNRKAAEAPEDGRKEAQEAADFDGRLWLEAMLDFVGKFPDEEPDMNYLIAERYRADGKFDQAREWYCQTRQKSQHYEQARFRTPMVLWYKYKDLRDGGKDEGKMKLCLMEAGRGFRDYLRWNKEARSKAVDPECKGDLVRKASTAEVLAAQAALKMANLAEKAEQAEDMVRNARDVIETLRGFEERYLHRKSFTNVHLIRIQAYAKLLDVENIEKELDRLKESEKKREGKGKKSTAVRDGLALAANAFLGAAEKEQDPEKKKEYNNKGAEYFKQLLNYDPEQKADMYIWVADQFFLMDRFEEAAEMYEGFLAKFGKDKETKREDVLLVRFRLAECCMKVEQYEKAIQYLTKLLGEPEWEKDWNATWMLIDGYVGKGLALEDAARRECMDEALRILNEMMRGMKPQSEEWYDCKVKIVEIYLHLEMYRGAVARVEMIDEDYLWGSQKRREGLADLLGRYADRIEDEEVKTRFKAMIEGLMKPVEVPVAHEEDEEKKAPEKVQEAK